ncbi:HugZ family pyridoxamine 5'-phosphate oxidase [Burkholderia sp. Ac-20379]|uniref:HugZ family pyridoxamine 5'-phosphate oxidase n=1 Tax=Burkholderia sp. Ac-20379 TaxID=2703900 RepID=UPI0019802AA2|nr:pyridoxamine 5'-phosphate oxidase family protein [Burkholderia sp. Ac-20379]MBN3723476.1 pyridoxamine 5'-phosphate oxidase [Burkholderia sp. Ac-20379]
MNISADLPIHLLHRRQSATLATQAREPAGFPYPTAVPYATDARHRPVVLISALAEHTRNLAEDPRAGLLVADGSDDGAGAGVLEAERMTLVGRCARVDADPHLAARYVRYHPDAARYLELGDFAFWALDCERLRFIGGFGRMGWLDGRQLDALPPLSFDEEQAAWALYPNKSSECELAGVDRYGADWRIAGRLRRTPFAEAAADFDQLGASLHAVASGLVLS